MICAREICRSCRVPAVMTLIPSFLQPLVSPRKSNFKRQKNPPSWLAGNTFGEVIVLTGNSFYTKSGPTMSSMMGVEAPTLRHRRKGRHDEMNNIGGMHRDDGNTAGMDPANSRHFARDEDEDEDELEIELDTKGMNIPRVVTAHSKREETKSADLSWSELTRVLLIGGDYDNLTMPKSTLEIPDYNGNLARTDKYVAQVTAAGALLFAFMLKLSYYLARDSNIQLSGLERTATAIVAICQGGSAIARLIPVLSEGWCAMRLPHVTGIFFCGIVVQFVAMTANGMMALSAKPPILVDPVTGAHVHLLRWSEWVPLVFVMTFLVDSCDIQEHRYGLKPAIFTALSQFLSTFCGYLIPFCTGFWSWLIVLSISTILWVYFFLRLKFKEARFKVFMDDFIESNRLDEKEIHVRSSLALSLFRACGMGWSYLVVSYFIFSVILPLCCSRGSLWRNPAWPLLSETLSDFLLKFIYMDYINAMHNQVFEEGARSKRRLAELRQMMWDNSSDVLAISVKSPSGVVLTMVSPTFFRLLRHSNGLSDDGAFDARGMLFEHTADDYEKLLQGKLEGHGTQPLVQPKLYDFDFGEFTLQNLRKRVTRARSMSGLVGTSEMTALAELMAKSWACKDRDSLIAHDLILRTKGDKLDTVQCEAKVTRIDETALFLVIRDVSERFRRFEAEKVALSEMTAREKDSEANRFTRHEVKNGLLAALGLCESLHNSMGENDSLSAITELIGSSHSRELTKLQRLHDDITETVTELDSALKEVMDTVLAEAMGTCQYFEIMSQQLLCPIFNTSLSFSIFLPAREVIHEAYQPHLERLDIAETINNSLVRKVQGSEDRFPVTFSPSPFPAVLFDRQLLKCIHRNAVSNACKYGKRGGTVKTHVSYEWATNELILTVTNLPGDRHQELINLGSAAQDMVFQPGKRLHPSFDGGQRQSSISRQSSGDGAWIMHKCAQTLNGSVRIDFRQDYTTFTLRCPATVMGKSQVSPAERQPFSFPPNTWGIAIDDSKVQRMLLRRFFDAACIPRKRTIIRGATLEDITGFDEFLVKFILDHPDDYFLVIVDENLEKPTDDICLRHETVSGSMIVQQIRHRLLPELERRMLALMRSANDSSHDVAIYNSRAHGFIPKQHGKEGVLDYLAPIWRKRFRSVDDLTDCEDTPSNNDQSMMEPDEVASYILETVQDVDVLVDSCGTEVSEFWPLIWEKLHSLKGDIVSLYDSESAIQVKNLVDDLRGRTFPAHFAKNWIEIKMKLQEVLEQSESS